MHFWTTVVYFGQIETLSLSIRYFTFKRLTIWFDMSRVRYIWVCYIKRLEKLNSKGSDFSSIYQKFALLGVCVIERLLYRENMIWLSERNL